MYGLKKTIKNFSQYRNIPNVDNSCTNYELLQGSKTKHQPQAWSCSGRWPISFTWSTFKHSMGFL